MVTAEATRSRKKYKVEVCPHCNGYEALLRDLLHARCENGCRADCTKCASLWDNEVAEKGLNLWKFHELVKEYHTMGVLV